MMETSIKKSGVTAYWVVTVLLCLGMVAGGVGQLLRLKFNVDGMVHLGYPRYLLSIIGVWKILGVAALLVPGYLLLKEWAYAGFFFLMTGAVISHITNGDPFQAWIAPLIFAILTVASWRFRPVSRKLKAVNFQQNIMLKQ